MGPLALGQVLRLAPGVGSWRPRDSSLGIELVRRTACYMTRKFFGRTEDKPYLPEGSDDSNTCNPKVSTSLIDRFVRQVGGLGQFDLIVSNKIMSNPHWPAPLEFDGQE